MSALWYPCTQMQRHEQAPPISIARAQGVYLYPAAGQPPFDQPLIDGISSWWTNLHGHGHPALVAAVAGQLQQLDHVMLAGLTHQPIQLLAEKLVSLTPAPLQKVFFADSGSAAVEVALKMSLQFWHQQGEPQRQHFISLTKGYHGETLGSLSVTDIPLFTAQYQPLLIQHIRAPSPDLTDKPAGMSEDDYIRQRLADMEALLQPTGEGGSQTVCAMIVEPLVQGAAGMQMYPASYLTGLRRLADRYQVHLILDEIAVGFGRTGTLFAHEQAGICPDFLCLSKGLTGGILPMSCVMTTDTVYQAFYSEQLALGFLHSHSFTGNPLAAQAALTSLMLFEQEATLSRISQLSQVLQQALSELDAVHFCHVRQTGLIGAFTVRQAPADFAPRMGRLAAGMGAWLRPIGAEVYVMPPYCITPEQLETLVNIACKASLQALEASSDIRSSCVALP